MSEPAPTLGWVPSRFDIHAASDVGKVRRRQEDAIALPAVEVHRFEQISFKLQQHCWAVVADGIGGHAAGDVASELAVAMFAATVAAMTGPEEVRSCLRLIDEQLHEVASEHPEFAGMGTTIAGVIITGREGLFFNLGDSRLYIHDAAGLHQRSLDHAQGHYLTGFLGGTERSCSDVPHVLSQRLSGPCKLIICTDGLSDMLSDAEISSVLLEGPAQPATALVHAALEAGGHDNVSVVVIDCN